MNAQSKTGLRRTLGLALATSLTGITLVGAPGIANADVGDPGLKLTKNVYLDDLDADGTVSAGDQLIYFLTAWNEGTSSITDAAFSDLALSGETCYQWDAEAGGGLPSRAAAADAGAYVVAPNGALTIGNRAAGADAGQDSYCVYTYTISPLDLAAGFVTNNATVSSASTGEEAGPVSLTYNFETGYEGLSAAPDAGATISTAPVTVNVTANDTFNEYNPMARGSVDLLDADGNAVDSLYVDGQGTYTVNADDTVTFVADLGFVGDSTASYRVADLTGNYSSSALTVTVAAEVPENQAPTANNDEGSAVAPGPVVVDVLANDTDGDSAIDPASLTLLDAEGNAVAEIVIEGQGTYAVVDGKVVFTPEADWAGTADSVRYQIADADGDTASAWVFATVEADATPGDPVPPVAADDSATGPVGEPLTIDVLANDTAGDSDIDRDSLTLLDAEGNASELNEVVVPNVGVWTIVDGNLVFTPEGDFTGTASVTYQIADAEGDLATATATATIEDAVVEPVLPVSNDDLIMLDYGLDNIEADVLANDEAGDSPIDPATLTLVDAEGNDVSELTVEGVGTFAVVNGKIAFTAEDDWNLERVEVQYRVADEDGDFGATATATFFGAPVLEASVGVDDVAETAYGNPITVDVLANDTTADDVTLDASTLTLINADGEPVETLAVEGGTYAVEDGKIVFTPTEGFSGVAESATYQVADSEGRTITAEVTVTVADEVIAPNSDAVDDKVKTAYETPITVDVLANDVAGEDLTFDVDSLTLLNADGEAVDTLAVDGGVFSVEDGKIVFTPADEFSGTAGPVTYRVTDSAGNDVEATVTVEVGEADDEPKPEPKPEEPKDDDEEKPDIVTGGDPTLANGGGMLAGFAALFAAGGLALRRKFGLASE